MSQPHRGRIAPSPPPPFTGTQADAFVGLYPWNAPKKAIGRERQLIVKQVDKALHVKHLNESPIPQPVERPMALYINGELVSQWDE